MVKRKSNAFRAADARTHQPEVLPRCTHGVFDPLAQPGSAGGDARSGEGRLPALSVPSRIYREVLTVLSRARIEVLPALRLSAYITLCKVGS